MVYAGVHLNRVFGHHETLTCDPFLMLDDFRSDTALRFLRLTGKPLQKPVAWRGPIVMNTQEELTTAFQEYQDGTFIKRNNANCLPYRVGKKSFNAVTAAGETVFSFQRCLLPHGPCGRLSLRPPFCTGPEFVPTLNRS